MGNPYEPTGYDEMGGDSFHSQPQVVSAEHLWQVGECFAGGKTTRFIEVEGWFVLISRVKLCYCTCARV